MKPPRSIHLAGALFLLTCGCETATEKNLVDGTTRRKNYDGDIQRPKDERLPHERRMHDQETYPWK